jgi:hypothetical protein
MELYIAIVVKAITWVLAMRTLHFMCPVLHMTFVRALFCFLVIQEPENYLSRVYCMSTDTASRHLNFE